MLGLQGLDPETVDTATADDQVAAAALDAELRPDVRAELGGHLADWGGITIVVTHSLADAAALAHDIVVLEAGRVTQRGSLAELTAAPATPYVQKFTADSAPST